jgi:cellulose biosynthesis protein BcsQ
LTAVVPSSTTARVIAIVNQKGGVGKSTTAVNLGASLAMMGRRVLVVDIDPQGNTTTGVGVDKRVVERDVYNVLLEGVPISDVVRSTEVENLDIAPATLNLAGAEVELVSAMQRENRLKTSLASCCTNYDDVLIDCPPSLGLLTVNALTAATEVIIPVQAEYYALEGLSQLISIVTAHQRRAQSGARDSRRADHDVRRPHQTRNGSARGSAPPFSGRVFATQIPRNIGSPRRRRTGSRRFCSTSRAAARRPTFLSQRNCCRPLRWPTGTAHDEARARPRSGRAARRRRHRRRHDRRAAARSAAAARWRRSSPTPASRGARSTPPGSRNCARRSRPSVCSSRSSCARAATAMN